MTPEQKACYLEWLKTAVCHHCGEVRHVNATCPKKKGQANQAHTVDDDSSDSDNQQVVMLALFGSATACIASSAFPRGCNWVIDSGCSHHMTPIFRNFSSYSAYPVPHPVMLVDNLMIDSVGEGSVVLTSIVNRKKLCITLQQVLHVPILKNSLLSVKAANHMQKKLVFDDGSCFIVDKLSGQVMAKSVGGGNLFNLHLAPHAPMASTAHASRWINLDLMHKHLGHPNYATLHRMIKKGLVKGVVVHDPNGSPASVCDACMHAKMTSAPFTSHPSCAIKHLKRVHSDICGDFDSPTIGGNHYLATLIDDMSGMLWVCPLRQKSDFLNWFIQMDSMFTNQFGRHVGALHTDNGGKYVNQNLRDYCLHHGIHLKLTVPYTPQQNGVAEHANHTLTEHMHVMMKDHECPLGLWGEAACTAAYCLNCTATSLNGGITPIKPPDISHMCTFYTDAYIHHHKDQGAKKLGDRAVLVKFVGYPDGVSGYKFWDPNTHTIALSCSPHFLEHQPPDIDTPPHTIDNVDNIDDHDDPDNGHTEVLEDDIQPL